MSDLHFRNVIAQAKQRNSLQLLDKAFQFLESDFDGFLGTKYSFENLVFFAETASLLGNREHYVERALRTHQGSATFLSASFCSKSRVLSPAEDSASARAFAQPTRPRVLI